MARFVIGFARSLEAAPQEQEPCRRARAGHGRAQRSACTSPSRVAGAIYETLQSWRQSGPARRMVAALARRTRQEPDGYLRGVRAHSLHAAFVVVSRTASPRDRSLRADFPVLPDRGHRPVELSAVPAGGLLLARHRDGGRGNRRAVPRGRGQPSARALLRHDRGVGTGDSGGAGRHRRRWMRN